MHDEQLLQVHNEQLLLLLLQVHDELLFEVRKDSLACVAAQVRRVMEGIMSLTVPMPVKLVVGPNWGGLQGDLHKYE